MTLLVTLASCGVPTQDSFDVIRDESFDVDPPTVTEPIPTNTIEAMVLPVRPYFVADNAIAPSGDPLGTYEAILNALQTRPEDGSGLRTAISTETVASIRPEGTAVVVDLTEAFPSLPPEEQRLAAAQIVLTLTDRSPGLRVSFALDGAPVDVPTADSSVSAGGSVTRSDYVALLAQK